MPAAFLTEYHFFLPFFVHIKWWLYIAHFHGLIVILSYYYVKWNQFEILKGTKEALVKFLCYVNCKSFNRMWGKASTIRMQNNSLETLESYMGMQTYFLRICYSKNQNIPWKMSLVDCLYNNAKLVWLKSCV